MTQHDKATLRALAEKATPGPWNALDDDVTDSGAILVAGGYCNGEANATYIAAAHPQAVLALLDEVERLREFYNAQRDIDAEGIMYAEPHQWARLQAARAAMEQST